MRRVATTLALALCLFVSGSAHPLLDRVELLTGLESCYAGGESPTYQGVLVLDPEYGTRIDGKGPVMWPVGYAGRGLRWGGVEVLDPAGNVVATTGKAYAIAPAPRQEEETQWHMDRAGAIAAPNCYPWDLVDCSPSTSDPDASYCPKK